MWVKGTVTIEEIIALLPIGIMLLVLEAET